MTEQKKARILLISAILHGSGDHADANLVLDLLQESENRMIALLLMIVLNIALIAARLWGA